MKFERLGNICTVRNGYAFKSELFNEDGVPVIRISDINGNYVTPENSIRTPYDKAFEQFKLSKGDILIAMSGATTGKYGIYSSDEIGYQNQRVGCFVIKDKSVLDNNYLLQTLKFLKPKIEKKAHGSGQPNISAKAIEDFEILLLPLSEQLHIAKLLSKAENLISLRKESIRLLDVFLKSTFLEMFGDPVRNEKGWETKELGKVTHMKAGQFVIASDIQSEFSEGLYSCYGGNGLRGYVKTYTHEGDFVLIGRQGALCGNVKIAKGQFHATEHAVVCSPKMQFETYWLYYLLDIINLNKYASGAAQPGLAVGRLEQIEIIYPPIELQTQFAQIVEKTEALKSQYQQSLQELENLYGSLSQKAFRGELSISKNRKAFQI